LKKETARKVYLKKRQELSSSKLDEASSLIIQSAIEIIKKYKPLCVHCFLTIDKKNEINTLPIIEYCWDNHIDVVVPVSNFRNNSLKSAKFNPNTKTASSKNNIPEPIDPTWVNDDQIDLVIVPLLAFDAFGNRVGYGRGFYDRLFSSLRKNVKKIGVSFFAPCEALEDIEEHDIPLTHCITPQLTHYF
jgi:5-formyltetrahydrofolate cyclo-ligase